MEYWGRDIFEKDLLPLFQHSSIPSFLEVISSWVLSKTEGTLQPPFGNSAPGIEHSFSENL